MPALAKTISSLPFSFLICSIIASTRGLGLLPAYAQNLLPRSLTSRPLQGDTPTVDLVLGYNRANQSPVLKLLLSRLDELVARVSKRAD
jgi:LysR family hca operon transcriptional activator